MDKPTLTAKRKEFFEEILKTLNTEPSKIDKVLNQDKFFVAPDMERSIIYSDSGDMLIEVNGKFYDKEFNIFYILWQVGDTLKIGIAINDDELQGAFVTDTHNEIYYIWGVKHDPKIDVSRGCVFYDWEFDVPHLYDSYKNQERFIYGVKHMHFRTLRILHDECERIFYSNKEFENENLEDVQLFEDLLKKNN